MNEAAGDDAVSQEQLRLALRDALRAIEGSAETFEAEPSEEGE